MQLSDEPARVTNHKSLAPLAETTMSSTNVPTTATAPAATPVTTLTHQPELVAALDPEDEEDQSDGSSTVGDDFASSTASITTSILEYRTIQGRTYHSDRHPTEYFTPNDEKQRDSVDISHHSLTLLIGGKLFLAPIDQNVRKVLDVGTGTGIWAIDFADEYPQAEVIGSDLSPIQSAWVPPNVKFEIDDATLPWSWEDNSFDFIHVRYLFGAIRDWSALFKQAYRCCAPGGWVQHARPTSRFEAMTVLQMMWLP